jgi:signal peptidase I
MKKLRKQAKELLQSANKIYHYRRDVMRGEQLRELERAVTEVQELLKRGEEVPLEAAMNRLHNLLKKLGGKMYPKTFWNDNIEVALVAAIIVIGIRTFFFQPFIIPTNSMFPTYSGMNAVLYQDENAGEPSAVNKLFRFATLGARHKSIVAERDGRVYLPFLGFDRHGKPHFFREEVPGRKFFIIPTKRAKFTVVIDGKPHSVIVPGEFAAEMNNVLVNAFDVGPDPSVTRIPNNNRFALLATDVEVAAGEDVLRFDITLGDALFVDRMSYHFVEPKAGDPFVFRTDAIQQEIGKWSGDYTNKYYIKRLSGIGGETLEIRDGVLLVDGEPRDEVEAFGRNARREGLYKGYINEELLNEGRELRIPEGKFVSLGDNSGNSLDSRFWGFVPANSVIGKALFIYYPFTERWGLAE